jgi:hypothetical protein
MICRMQGIMICRMNGWCTSSEALPPGKRKTNNYNSILKKPDQKTWYLVWNNWDIWSLSPTWRRMWQLQALLKNSYGQQLLVSSSPSVPQDGTAQLHPNAFSDILCLEFVTKICQHMTIWLKLHRNKTPCLKTYERM